MRISDWSSDVCSSDLQRLRGAGALQTVGDLVRNEGQQLLVAGGVFGAVVIALYGQHAQCAFTADQRHAEPAAGIAWRALQFATGVQLPNMCGRCGVAHIVQQRLAGDRTSVVSGKRVSVRLDLGGRRIIKKKKNTNK